MKNILSLFLIVIWVSVKAQIKTENDTIYFNAQWVKTIHDSAFYYRVIIKKDSLFNVEDHYQNGKIQMTGTYKSFMPDVRQGYFRYYATNGTLADEGLYIDNKREGRWKYYYETGQLHTEQVYKDGINDGDFIIYYTNGNIRRKEILKDTTVQQGKCYDESGKEVKYFRYQQLPSFNGNISAYIIAHTKYPRHERKNGVTGEVIVSFVVEKDGSVNEVKLVQGTSDEGLNKAALKAVTYMPKWTPGMQDGKPVRIEYNVPIRFKE